MSGNAWSGLRVLMTTDGVGGVWEYALELARGLAAHDVEVVLAAVGPALAEDQRVAASRVPGLVLEERESRLEWMPGYEDDAERSGTWLMTLAARHKPDLVHLNTYHHAALHWRVPCLLVAHSCVWTWWRAVHGCSPPETWSAYRRRVHAALWQADLVVTPSCAFAKALRETYGFDGRCKVIYNGRDAHAYRSKPGGSVILSAGRLWDEGKNLQALVHVAPWLSWPVVVAGEANGSWRERCGLVNVELLGRLPHRELIDHYARAPIFAWPARYEPFGLAVLEAALSGCALVLGDIPTLRELWLDAAVFVDPEDRGALYQALQGLIETPRHRDTLALAARRRALRYSSERMAAEYCGLYGQLLAKLSEPAA